eukprot:c23059_g1_i1 orf=95-1546(-)
MSNLLLESSQLHSAVTAHIVVIPFPSQGHINPLMQFCKRLVSKGVTITFVMVDGVQQRQDTNPATARTASANCGRGIRIEYVTMAGCDLSKGFGVSFAAMFDAVAALGGPVGELIERLNLEVHPVSCIIYDGLVSTWACTLARKFHIPAFAFITSSTSSHLLWLYMKSLLSKGLVSIEDAVGGFVEDRDRLITNLRGLPLLRVSDLPRFKHVANDTDCLYRWMMRDAEHLQMAEGILSNTFYELESEAIDTIEQQSAPVFAVGPLIGDKRGGTSLWKEDQGCLDWLDTQPARCVLYISFGSITILSVVQFEEIVLGLKASKQRFLWVFRPDLIDDSSYDGAQHIKEKTQNQGYVVSWSPQLKVLAHPAVGGFLTHCGWNSTLESIGNGIPMICWPYFADQTLTSLFITTVWKNGIELHRVGGVASRDEVERVITTLMEGEEGERIRKRAAKLKEAARMSLVEGGTSQKSLERFVNEVHKRLRG